MIIKSLELENFRNYETLSIDFDSGTNILFGYYQSAQPLDHQAMRRALGDRLPHYAVPVGLVWTEEFPKTLSGKVNRHGFPPPPELDDHKLLAQRYH